LGALPYDPQNGAYTDCTDYNTDYTIYKDATTQRVTVCAPSTQIPPATAASCTTR